MKETTVLVLLVLAAAMALAQAPDSPRFVGAPATAVLVDVVVRDQRGVLVTDLDASAVEVFEDGVKQAVVLFEPPRGSRHAVSRSDVPNSDSRRPVATPGSSTPTGAPHLVALVFEGLGPEARAASYKAAQVYLALPLQRTLAPHDVAPLLVLEQGTRPRDFQFAANADTSLRPIPIRALVEHRVFALRAARRIQDMPGAPDGARPCRGQGRSDALVEQRRARSVDPARAVSGREARYHPFRT
jgi:hypothetical protein